MRAAIGDKLHVKPNHTSLVCKMFGAAAVCCHPISTYLHILSIKSITRASLCVMLLIIIWSSDTAWTQRIVYELGGIPNGEAFSYYMNHIRCDDYKCDRMRASPQDRHSRFAMLWFTGEMFGTSSSCVEQRDANNKRSVVFLFCIFCCCLGAKTESHRLGSDRAVEDCVGQRYGLARGKSERHLIDIKPL